MAKKLQRNVSRPRAGRGGGGAVQAGSGSNAPRRSLRGRVSGVTVTEFTIQLATLVEAGIPIVRALNILERQVPSGPFRRVLGEVVEDVSSGTTLSESMGKHSGAFDPLYSSMVRAGEAAGVLDQVLLRLAKFRERAAEIRAKVFAAVTYPVIVVLIATLVITIMVAFVIPKFEEVFTSMNLTLPDLTRHLLAVSRFVVDFWYVVLGVPVLLGIFHLVLMGRSSGYRYFIHRMMLRVPYLGDVLQRSITATFARTFGTLVEAGVPHLDSLSITRDTSSNEVLLRAVEDVYDAVREGETIARPMSESGAFDDLTTNMVEVGEQTGELDRMLLRVADAYEVQVERRIDALFKVLEPLLLVVMAVFVGVIVVALFLPMLSLISGVGSGV